MTQTYSVTGMTCEGCKAKVSYLLKNVPGVTDVEIDLQKGQVAVTMDKHLPTETLAAPFQEYPKYQLSETLKKESVVAPAERSWVATYKPLLIIFSFITGISLLASFHQQQFHLMLFMQYFMAGFFLVFSFFKLLDLKGFSESYRMYDILAARVPVWGIVYPFVELLLGVAYLTGFYPGTVNIITIVVMGVSSVGVIQSVVNKKKIRCACLGAVFNLPMSSVTIIEDVLMIVMATAVIAIY